MKKYETWGQNWPKNQEKSRKREKNEEKIGAEKKMRTNEFWKFFRSLPKSTFGTLREYYLSYLPSGK